MEYYKIAGLTVAMDTFGSTLKQAQPYRCEPAEQPDVVIEAMWETYKEKLLEKYPNITADVGEYLYSGAKFYKELLTFDGMMLHSSAVVVDGKAYLFSADPGTGKSTHTKLWLEKFGERAYILNDDKPALRLENGRWMAYGTPWSGKHDISVNTGVPLAGIAMIERGETNEIDPHGGTTALRELLAQINRPKGAEYRVKLLELLDKLITQVPIWKLHCNMTPEAADVAYAAMKTE